MKIYIENRVCIELGLDYNIINSSKEISLKDFNEKFYEYTRYPEKKDPEKLSIIGDQLIFKNISTGWFEILPVPANETKI